VTHVEERADGVFAIERLQQSPDLSAVPYIAALELRQGDPTVVDVVKNGRELQGASI
jgi:hypothetical protein